MLIKAKDAKVKPWKPPEFKRPTVEITIRKEVTPHVQSRPV